MLVLFVSLPFLIVFSVIQPILWTCRFAQAGFPRTYENHENLENKHNNFQASKMQQQNKSPGKVLEIS